jgi:uncharacterized protein (TIGR03435 family)
MRFITAALAVVLALPAFPGPRAAAQAQAAAPAPGRPAFEVASIRQNKSGEGLGNQRRLPGGRFVATNMPLRNLIRIAFGNAFIFRAQEQIIGAPGWIDSERFDIEAKAAAEFVPDADGVTRQHLAMLRTLLEDRFALQARVEQRELPIYELVRAKKDGTLGPDMKPSAFDCRRGAPPPAHGVTCGVSNDGPALVGRGVPMTMLIGFLNISPAVGRLVTDKTGLTGTYDMRLTFVRPFVLGPGGAVANPDTESGPTIFTALQEQLGLKLEARKGPVDVLVIDKISRLAEEK